MSPTPDTDGVLRTCSVAPTEHYDVAVLDLDGVVYRGDHAVRGAVTALSAARRAGMQLAFVTNNAARTPDDVAARLRGLGVHADADDVVTSAQAAARLVAAAVPRGSSVFLLGGEGLARALAERGLEPVAATTPGIAAVAQGYGPDLPWRQVVRGAMLVRDGLPWVVSNTDLTLPTADGIGPGTGTLVKLVADFAGRTPQVAGKPETPLFEETLARVGGERPLVIGDRVDTDIAGARRLGWDSLLVLTGVTGLDELVAIPADRRPTYLAADLAALGSPQPAPEQHHDGWRLGGWDARVDRGRLQVAATPHETADRHDWWRVAAAAAWHHLDRTGVPARTEGLHPPAAGSG